MKLLRAGKRTIGWFGALFRFAHRFWSRVGTIVRASPDCHARKVWPPDFAHFNEVRRRRACQCARAAADVQCALSLSALWLRRVMEISAPLVRRVPGHADTVEALSVRRLPHPALVAARAGLAFTGWSMNVCWFVARAALSVQRWNLFKGRSKIGIDNRALVHLPGPICPIKRHSERSDIARAASAADGPRTSRRRSAMRSTRRLRRSRLRCGS